VGSRCWRCNSVLRFVNCESGSLVEEHGCLVAAFGGSSFIRIMTTNSYSYLT
jgi:hypothetical protein